MPMVIQRQKLKTSSEARPVAADLFRAFARSTPWRIVDSLRSRPKTISEIASILAMTPKAVRAELGVLQAKSVLAASAGSQETLYRLSDKRILHALDLIREASKRVQKKAKLKESAGKASGKSRKSQV